jgi:hypothetical protein
MNLHNAEATFGKDSTQYLDVLEILEIYMSKIVAEKQEPHRQQPAAAKEQGQCQPLMNLVFRPKP